MAADDEATKPVGRISDSASAEYVAHDIQMALDDVPPGYKRTKVGVIPEDWKVRPLNLTAPLQRGFDLPLSQIESGSHPIVYSNGISGSHSRAMVRGPGVVTGRSGTIGVFHYVAEDFWPHNTTLWVTDFKGNLPKFIYYFYTALGFERFASGSGVPTLNRNDAHGYHVAVPTSVAEQHAIATALSDMDGLLDALDKLIAKKRAIKQAAMQQLLTGCTRLPGFSGAWETKRLGHVASIRNKKIWPSTVPSHTPCIELEHIGQAGGQLLDASTAGHSVSTKYQFESGDVLFGRLRSYLRKYWLADYAGLCTTEIWPLVADNIQMTSGYLYALVQTDRFIEEASISYGTHMPRADWQVIAALQINLPPIDEQTAIATVLSDMDTEIDALEQRRAKTRELKTGMMQQLLTGRVRLVQPEAPHAEAAT